VGYFTSGFGIRKSPIGGRVKMHEGLDIANRPGTPIKAPADGTVLYAEAKSGYGQTLILDHGYGLETWYGHTRKILVSKGQHIRRGEAIALLGNSGRSTGPHLHYEVRVHGTPVDPLSYILEN
jgi:murein DD-endopeptidase MepM/ murein hydrolase activator NlpD